MLSLAFGPCLFGPAAALHTTSVPVVCVCMYGARDGIVGLRIDCGAKNNNKKGVGKPMSNLWWARSEDTMSTYYSHPLCVSPPINQNAPQTKPPTPSKHTQTTGRSSQPAIHPSEQPRAAESSQAGGWATRRSKWSPTRWWASRGRPTRCPTPNGTCCCTRWGSGASVGLEMLVGCVFQYR